MFPLGFALSLLQVNRRWTKFCLFGNGKVPLRLSAGEILKETGVPILFNRNFTNLS